MLIGLVGLIGSGKDTVAERLATQHGFERDSFAKSLKMPLLVFLVGQRIAGRTN